MTRLSKLPLFLGLLLSPLAWAQETPPADPVKYYDVEIVIFRNVNVPRGYEYNLPTPLTRRPPSSLDLFDPASIDKAAEFGFTPLVAEELRLQGIVQSITRSSRYGLLLHTGWRQPGLEEGQSLPVWIRGGELFDNTYQSIDQVMVKPAAVGQEADSPASPAAILSDTHTALALTATTPAFDRADGLYELEGQITIVLSRYLHTHANLVFRKPASQAARSSTVDAAELQTASPITQRNLLFNYALNEKRRMRSKRLHYLDHPEFGLLVLITPYDGPPPGQKTTAETAVTPVNVDSQPTADSGQNGT